MMGIFNRLPLLLKLGTGVVMISGLLFWFYSHAVIEISVSNQGSGEITYSLVSQPSQKNNSFKTKENKISKRVAKGSYEVLVTQGDKNYFTVIKTGSFLSKTSISAPLSQERLRAYVGNNPSSCMYYDSVLYSYECGNSFGQVNKHIPADVSLPTYTDKFSIARATGLLEGLVKTSDSSVALFHLVDIEGPSVHVGYSLDGNLQPVDQVTLKELTTNETYSLVSYKRGFLVYNPTLDKLFYYSSLAATPDIISMPRPSDATLKPISLKVYGDTISVLYSSLSNEEQSTAPVKNKNEVVIYSDKSLKYFTYNGSVTDATVCGQNLVCLISNKVMSVYKYNDNGRQLLYTVGDINTMQAIGDKLLLVRGKDVLSINTTEGKGQVDYSLGDYGYCGLQIIDSTRYALCLTVNDNRKMVLLVNRGIENKDSIDKKIQKLQKLPSVSSVSIYGNRIFVTPKLGQLVYDEALKSYIYDPTTKQRVDRLINNELEALEIDKSSYIIMILD